MRRKSGKRHEISVTREEHLIREVEVVNRQVGAGYSCCYQRINSSDAGNSEFYVGRRLTGEIPSYEIYPPPVLHFYIFVNADRAAIVGPADGERQRNE